MQWLTQHADAISSIGIICAFIFWMKKSMEKRFESIDKELKQISHSINSIGNNLSYLEGFCKGMSDNIGSRAVPLIEAKPKRRRRSKTPEV